MPQAAQRSHAKGRMTLSALNTAKTIASATGGGVVPDGTIFALIQAQTQNVRWTDNGDTPTASSGHRLAAWQTLEYDADLTKLKFIEETGSATLEVTFYGL